MGAIAVIAALAMAMAQIAIPLMGHHAGLSTVVVAGLAIAAVATAATAWGATRVAVAAVAVTALALAVEIVGTRTGWPFGAYRYTGALQPTIAHVPVVVGAAWLGMGLAGWEVAGRLARTNLARVAVGAVALTGWDLFLDPQMTHERFWRWTGGGAYRGVPISNFAGWLLCSAAVMIVLAALLPGTGRSPGLLGLYAWMAVMETLGFLVFFGDALVAVVGAAVTLPLTVLAWRAPA